MQCSLSSCMMIVVLVEYFEKELINLNPAKPTLSYTVNDIYNQLNSFEECNMLVYELRSDMSVSRYNPDNGAYTPYGRQYIKERLLKYLQHLNCFVCFTNMPHFSNRCELRLEAIGHVRSSRILMTSHFLLRVRFRSLDVLQLASGHVHRGLPAHGEQLAKTQVLHHRKLPQHFTRPIILQMDVNSTPRRHLRDLIQNGTMSLQWPRFRLQLGPLPAQTMQINLIASRYMYSVEFASTTALSRILFGPIDSFPASETPRAAYRSAGRSRTRREAAGSRPDTTRRGIPRAPANRRFGGDDTL